MTTVKCNLIDCLNNENGICKLESIDLDATGEFECLDYETLKDIETAKQLRERFGI